MKFVLLATMFVRAKVFGSARVYDLQQGFLVDSAVPAVDQKEVECLFWRFRSLDRGRKGFVTREELLAIPELSINPLASRIVRMLDGSNFRDFVMFLAAFSRRASPPKKMRFLFQVYDIDGDGLLNQDDLRSMMSYLVGGEFTEEQAQAFLSKCIDEAGKRGGVDFETFCQHVDISEMKVEVPTND